jgi:hypothetical protein
MLDLMRRFEPRFEEKNETIFEELDEVSEVILFVRGSFDIGFEINGKKIFVKRFTNSSKSVNNSGAMIGAHGVSFGKTSRFVYKTATRCEGFFVRKKYWTEVMQKHNFVSQSLYQQIDDNFARISGSIMTFKNFQIAKLKSLSHIDQYKFAKYEG